MNTNHYHRPHLKILSFFVFRSGIPMLQYLVALTLITDSHITVQTLLMSVPILFCFHILCGKRSVDEPGWVFGLSALALPAAALVDCVSEGIAKERIKFDSIFARCRGVAQFQENFEVLLDVTSASALLTLCFLCWASASVLKNKIGRPIGKADGKSSLNLVRPIFLFCVLTVLTLLTLASPTLIRLENAAESTGLENLKSGRVISFSHPRLNGSRYPEMWQGSTGPIYNLKDDNELLDVYESVAQDLLQREFEISELEAYVVWILCRELDRIETLDKRAANFAATVLALNRHWDLGCTEELTDDFRKHTLAYLASSHSGPKDLAFYQKLEPYLALKNLGGRERQILSMLQQEGPNLELLGKERLFRLSFLYYAVENMLFSAHPELSAGNNPELKALKVVVELRERLLRNGSLPSRFHVDKKLGSYQRIGPRTAKLTLVQLDPKCRPERKIIFGP